MAAPEQPLFLAFVRREERIIVDARNGLELATLLPLLFSGSTVVGLLMSFENQTGARDWSGAPTIASWGASVCQAGEDPREPQIPLGRGGGPASPQTSTREMSNITAVLMTSGGFVAC